MAPRTPLAVGVDVGGTKIAAGLVDGDGAMLARTRVDTPEGDSAAVVEAIASAVAELGDRAVGAPVGVAAAGFVDADRSHVVFAPNLAWRNEPLRDRVAARLGARVVVVENDANAAAWGEARFGAGAGRPAVVAVTVGTGIGGGVVLDGHLVRGRFGMAAELGHLPLVADGIVCGCGQYGCWEKYASGSALVRRGRDLVRSGAPAAVVLREACGGDPDELTGPMVSDAAAAGDAAARALLAETGGWLGAGMAAVAAVLDPGCFVVGGGVASAGELLLEPARRSYHRRLPAAAVRAVAEIVPATLGNDAGVVGAADLARRVS